MEIWCVFCISCHTSMPLSLTPSRQERGKTDVQERWNVISIALRGIILCYNRAEDIAFCLLSLGELYQD